MHYPRSVAITYDTTMREVGPAAAALFRLLSWFAADPLPLGVLEASKATEILTEAVQCDGNGFSEVFVDDAFAELAAFSMVKRTDVQGTPCFSQHRLVQELTQNQIPTQARPHSIHRAVCLLIEFAPKDSFRPEVWKEWKLLVPHADALWQLVKLQSQDQWSTALMDGLALYYLGQGRYDDAIPIQRDVVKLKQERRGVDDAETLLAKNDLALLLNSSGQATEAQPIYRETLAGRERVHGQESEEVAETLHNLGFSLMGTGELQEAESHLRRAFAIFQIKSGEFHWRTLMTEYSLAQLLLKKGETENAASLIDQNIRKKREHLPGGENHPDTLDSIQSLAEIKLAQGDLNQAENLAKRAVAGRETSLGKDDPSTLYSITTLMVIYQQSRQYAMATGLQNQLIDSVLRFGNPAGLLSVRQLALELFLKGDYGRVETLLRRLLDKRFEIPGNHCHLARVLILMGREHEARDEVEKAWEYRADGPPYVIPRILFFRLLFTLLDTGALEQHLARLKFSIQRDNVFSEWTIQPVIDHLKQRLSKQHFDLLHALAAVLADQSKLGGLDSFEEWREVQPVEFE